MFCFCVYCTCESVNFAHEHVLFRNVHSYMKKVHLKMIGKMFNFFFYIYRCVKTWVSHARSTFHVIECALFMFPWVSEQFCISCKRGSYGLGGRSARISALWARLGKTLGVPLKFVRLLPSFWSLVTWRNWALHRQLVHCCFKTS